MFYKNHFFFLTICLIFSTTIQAQIHHHHDDSHVVEARLQPAVIEKDLAPFYHGIASGDPLADRVMLWTRVTPEVPNTESIEVQWQIATDTLFEDIVNYGTVYTNGSKDFTVKVDADNLEAYAFYYYRFYALGKYSLIGRTKTAPNTASDNLRFAVVSCSNYEAGYFNAYRNIADQNNVDAVIHLGDYIYEYGNGQYGDTRLHEPANEIVGLGDYRTRHAHYKLDPDLRFIHQNFPFITTWDDHESANNSWSGGAANHDVDTEGDWNDRKTASIRAYHEWMPLRQPDINDNERIYRKFNYGNLADIFVLDTRLEARSVQAGSTFADNIDDPERTLIGMEQMEWLTNELSTSTAQWKVIAQQVMIAPLQVAGVQINVDQWNGYPAERARLLDYIWNNNIENVVVLTGDIHTAWGNDIPYSNYDSDTGDGSVAVEFVTTSVTSPGFPFPVGQNIIRLLNSHVKYVNLTEHGFFVLDLTAEKAEADWYIVPTLDEPSTGSTFVQAQYVNAGERHLNEATVPAPYPLDMPSLAPANPPEPIVKVYPRILLEGAYNVSSNSMTTTLYNNNLITAEQPFNRLPWNYEGTEIVSNTVAIGNDITDWVLVEIRNAADSSEIIEKRAGILLQNGWVKDIDGSNGLSFRNLTPNKEYFVSVRSRNHLAVISQAAIMPLPYDFTSEMSQALGNGQLKELEPNVFGLFAGDFDANGVLTYSDFNAYILHYGSQNSYQNADVNLDGVVDDADFEMYQNNISKIGIDVIKY
ncbi:MAG: alkaline phosphatase D family protein [Chitinophagales bacterium]